MSDVQAELRDAYENDGHDVGEVSDNRGRIRIVLLDEQRGADLESIATDVLGDENVLGTDVTTESVEGYDGVSTVVSVRHRA